MKAPSSQSQMDQSAPLLPWTLSFLRPHRKQVSLLIVLLVAQIALGALQPWPLKIVIDYVLSRQELPERKISGDPEDDEDCRIHGTHCTTLPSR